MSPADGPPEEWRRYDAPYPSAGYRPYDPGAERSRVRRRVGLLVVGGLVVVGGAGAGIAALVVNALDGDSGPSTSTTTTTTTRTEIRGGDGQGQLFSAEGVARMLEALVKETGSPLVHEVAIVPGRAVLTVPGTDGPRTLVWDGRSMTAVPGGASPREPFDLTRLDGAVLARLCGSRPESCAVVAGRPLPGTGNAWLTVAGLDGVHLTDLAGKAV
jgi:hypothetical protein